MSAHPTPTGRASAAFLPGQGLTRLAGAHLYRALLVVVLAANLALGAYVVAVVLPAVVRLETANWQPRGVVLAPSPSPSATPELAPMAVAIPADADCSACHSAPGVTRPRPVMAHPLAGWESCTACHATDKLVATAPGHESIHREECLACHKAAADQSAPPKPHHTFNGTSCTLCHGNPSIPQAPLPADMANRTSCWVCHGLTQGDELWNGPVAPGPPAVTGQATSKPPAAPVLYRLAPAATSQLSS